MAREAPVAPAPREPALPAAAPGEALARPAALARVARPPPAQLARQATWEVPPHRRAERVERRSRRARAGARDPQGTQEPRETIRTRRQRSRRAAADAPLPQARSLAIQSSRSASWRLRGRWSDAASGAAPLRSRVAATAQTEEHVRSAGIESHCQVGAFRPVLQSFQEVLAGPQACDNRVGRQGASPTAVTRRRRGCCGPSTGRFDRS